MSSSSLFSVSDKFLFSNFFTAYLLFRASISSFVFKKDFINIFLILKENYIFFLKNSKNFTKFLQKKTKAILLLFFYVCFYVHKHIVF